MYFSLQRTPPAVVTMFPFFFFFFLQKLFLSQRKRKNVLWFWKKTNSAHSSMHVYKHIYIYVHCYLFPFDYPYVNIVLIMAKDTLFFLKKKIISFFEGKKNRVFTYIYIHTHIHTHTHTHIYIYIYIWIKIMLTYFLLAIMQPWGHDRLSPWLAPQQSWQNVKGEILMFLNRIWGSQADSWWWAIEIKPKDFRCCVSLPKQEIEVAP